MLPGQRDGSLLWHKDNIQLLRDKLGMTPHTPYPCMLKTRVTSCFVLNHVDDILVVGRRDFVMLAGCLKSKYEIVLQRMQKPGDEVDFLWDRRKMTLLPDGRLTIELHHKHVQQMCSLLGLNKRVQGKKTPNHVDMDQQDLSGELAPADAKVFRACVSVLLYLAADLPHCQHVVRHFATYSTQPTMKNMTVLI